jgi:uncharacterized Ntn-hydrolase superfamily protein
LTYSIVARDPETEQLGVAVATHALAVGGLCPWVAPEAGAVATQALVEVGYGPRMIDALRQSRPPEEALRALLHLDSAADVRQVAAVDATGRVAVHTGARCISVAGHRTGDGFSCQANMMRDPGVPEAMAESFAASTGRQLVHRLLAALDAAQAAGGDIRGLQSAAIKVVAGRPGAEQSGWLLDVRIDDHDQPLEELNRLVLLHEACNASEAEGPDASPDAPARVAELGRGNPEGWFWYGVSLANQGRTEEAAAALQKAYAVSSDWRELLERIPHMLPDDPAILERLLQGQAV